MLDECEKPVKILDAGGTLNFWQQMGYINSGEIDLTIINIEPPDTSNPNIKCVTGDVCDLSRYKDDEFDIVFSNSVIEHVGGAEERKKMATEIKRAGKKYFVQTPNCNFPFEPHFLFPFFQFLPRFSQTFLLTHFRMGWFEKCTTNIEAWEIIDSIHLLKKKELCSLFPGAKLLKEKFFGMTKSFIILTD